MSVNERDAGALLKLLKVARARTDEAGRRIAELQSALGLTEASLQLLADSISSEEAAARAAETVGFFHLSGFLAGAAAKRATLLETRAAIDAELQSARARLADAFSEMKKLEHLADRSRIAAAASRRKRENALLDDAALSRFRRTHTP